MRRAFSTAALPLIAFILVLALALAVTGQNREKFGISAKAGGVNAVTGRAETRPAPSTDWQLLNVTDDLKAGDFVRTGHDGMVEMLLNPGAYLRVAENSEFQLTDNTLETLEIKLLRGTGIIEATGSEDTELSINITTPHAKMQIVRRGLYRVNVVPGNTTELIVRKGRVLLADSHTKITGGNKVIFNSSSFSVAKLRDADKKKDTVDGWSKGRASLLARANQRLSARDVNSFLSGRSSWSPMFSARASGIWYYNGMYGCFTFLPFLFGWDSPYGSSYPSTYYFGPFGCCRGAGSGFGSGFATGRVLTRPPISTVTPSSGPTFGPGPISRSGSNSGSGGSGGERRISPPPARDPDAGRPTRESQPTSQPTVGRGRPNR